MITVNGVGYVAGGKAIVGSVDLNVRKGAFTCVMGPNGAGKSTLIKIICGLYKPSTGSVLIGGRNINSFTRRELAKLVGYVPQNSPTDIRFTVEEYVATGRYPYQTALGGSSMWDIAVIREVMEITGVYDLRERDISTLSGGERQRVMIAAALAQETPVLLLDEPTIFLDPKSTVDLLLLLRRVHNAGATIVMVTHDVNQALMFGTDHVGIKGGKLLFHTDDVEKLLDSGDLDRLFAMKFKKIYHDEVLQVLPCMDGAQ